MAVFFPCSTYSSPVVVDGVLYTGSYCGDFEALDAVTGQVLWSKSNLGGVIDSAAVADGVVYVTAKEAATVYAFNSFTGAAVHICRIASFGVQKLHLGTISAVQVWSVEGHLVARC